MNVEKYTDLAVPIPNKTPQGYSQSQDLKNGYDWVAENAFFLSQQDTNSLTISRILKFKESQINMRLFEF